MLNPKYIIGDVVLVEIRVRKDRHVICQAIVKHAYYYCDVEKNIAEWAYVVDIDNDYRKVAPRDMRIPKKLCTSNILKKLNKN